MSTVVDMDNLDFDEAISVARSERFSMPPVVVAALRQAGKKATLRLLEMMEDDKKFEALTQKERMEVIREVMNRAYGKSETASASLQTLHNTGQVASDTGMGNKLADIEKRMEAQNVSFPEMKKAGGRARLTDQSRPAEDVAGGSGQKAVTGDKMHHHDASAGERGNADSDEGAVVDLAKRARERAMRSRRRAVLSDDEKAQRAERAAAQFAGE